MSSNSRYQPFVAVSGNFVGKISIVDDVLFLHEQDYYPTTSIDENCKVFEFQTYRKGYVDLRQTYLALKLKFVKGRGYETYKTKKFEKGAQKKQISKQRTPEEKQEAPVFLVAHVNNILHSVFFYNFEVYVNNQPTYKSNG